MNSNKGLGLFKLTCFAIGTTLASGVFSMPGDFATNGAGTLAVIIGWVIAGIGMYALAVCFYRLSIVRPDLRSGIFTYAREGFGEFIGFSSAWGYWISAILSQVSFATLLFAALGQFFRTFGDGNNLMSVICASIVVWLFTLFIMGGVSEAVTINTVIVIAKALPILAFILLIIFAGSFDINIFLDNFRGEDTGLSLGDQILDTTYTTVWIFTGIEGAVVISGRAKNASTAGRATEVSFLILLGLYVVISLLSMGVMPRTELERLSNPAMAEILSYVVGPWGATLVNIGVIISIAGAMFSYTILTADCAFAPAAMGCFPRFLSIENKKHVPIGALITTSLIVQGFLIIVYYQSSTYQSMYKLATSAIMIPFVLSALYCLKLTMRDSRLKQNTVTPKVWLISIVGTLYGFWLLVATGIENILISAMLYGPGIILYVWSRLENKMPLYEGKNDIIGLIVVLIGFGIVVIGRIFF